MSEPYKDPRVITCLACGGNKCDKCGECKGAGKIRVPTRAENEARDTLYNLLKAEIATLRKACPEAAFIPCGVCGRLWQFHVPFGDLWLCPMDAKVGPAFSPR